jgi:holin-like protein
VKVSRIFYGKDGVNMLKYIKQICIILGICLLAEIMEYFIPLPIAASIYGLILMLIALMTKIVPLKEVEDVADFLTGNIAILFIPPTVGIMASVEEIKQILIPLLVICISTTLLIMGVTGWVTQIIIRKGKPTEE